MAKIDKNSLVKLIENLVDKLVESKVERLVEQRVQKITPMLVEHEVNRLLREMENDVEQRPNINETTSKGSGNKIVDDVMGDSEIEDKRDLREHFRTLVNGGKGAKSNDVGRTVSATSKDVHSVAAGSRNFNGSRGATPPPTTPDGKPVDTSDPNVQNVLNIMNQDFSKTLKNMKENSKRRGGQLPTNG